MTASVISWPFVNLIQSVPPGCLSAKHLKSYNVLLMRHNPSSTLSSFRFAFNQLKIYSNARTIIISNRYLLFITKFTDDNALLSGFAAKLGGTFAITELFNSETISKINSSEVIEIWTRTEKWNGLTVDRIV